MKRRDQYGTHDERGAGPARGDGARARDERTVQTPDRGGEGRRAPNFGSGGERAARTTGGGDVSFQGRDYETEDYGAGFGTQRRGRDVPDAGRKGDWMRERVRPKGWRGQVAGDGLDGLASERAFGSDDHQQMSKHTGGAPSDRSAGRGRTRRAPR